MVVVPMLPDATESCKFNMAAFKPELLISQLPDKIAAKFQQLHALIFSGTASPTAFRSLLRDVTGSRDSKMAASKPEVSVTPLPGHPGQTESKFQPLRQGFWGRPSR